MTSALCLVGEGPPKAAYYRRIVREMRDFANVIFVSPLSAFGFGGNSVSGGGSDGVVSGSSSNSEADFDYVNYVHEDDQQYFADYGDGDIVVQANYPLGPPTLVSRVKDWFEGFRPPEREKGRKRKKRLRDKKNQVMDICGYD